MRKIKKTGSPRDISPPDQPIKRSLRQVERSLRSCLARPPMNQRSKEERSQVARAQFNSLYKNSIRKQLREDQKSICIYCERRLNKSGEGDEDGNEDEVNPIEHWCPVNQWPEFALCWRNMYLSCPTKGTCDDLKNGDRLEIDQNNDLPWPADFPYENFLGYKSNGEIFVRSDTLDDQTAKALKNAIGDLTECDPTKDDPTEISKKSVLNLNDPRLIAARRSALRGEMDAINRKYPNRHVERKVRQKRAENLLKEDPLTEFVSIIVSWLGK